MAVVLNLRWADVSPQQYEAVKQIVRWEEDPPDGLVLHIAWFEEGAMQVVDVWNAESDFERFFGDRIAPAVKEAGFPGEPESRVAPLYRYFVPPGASASG
ncbi:hypothetical protein ABT063_01625 [Streptomyces sp. NPDC002838]|uniref:hypothetical protein n=1 Tax=Streptomyces sp. NPDC002838 TaxID=3154436 RepID=UPI00332FEA17